MLAPHPLTPPERDSPAARLLLRHLRLRTDGASPRELLNRIAAAFSRIPYENLTKIIKHAQEGVAARARRWPLEVVQDFIAYGTGGTCFSLTAALLHLVRYLGFTAEPILADRRYGANTHCALLVWVDNNPQLLDPGYLIVQPLPLLQAGEVRVPTEFNELVLVPREGGAQLDLFTRQQRQRRYRLTYRTAPVDAGEFLRAWDASFDWDMMHYPVLTTMAGGRQLYVQGNRLLVRSAQSVLRKEIAPEELPALVAVEFGIDPAVAARSLDILGRRGAGEQS